MNANERLKKWLKKCVLYGLVICLPALFRKLFQNPHKILGHYIEKGMKVLDVGCAMGFFTLPLAGMVGPNGKVICVDMQDNMIRSLEKRARKTGLSDRIETRICHRNSLGLDDLIEEIDFAVAFAVVHEIPDVSGFFSEIYKSIKPNGKFLIAEPKGHVSEKDFEICISVARQNGFTISYKPQIGRSHTVLLGKNLREAGNTSTEGFGR